jgi:glycine oxidase
MLLLKTPVALSQRVINVGQRYLVFRQDGHILVGSCEEETGFELATTASMLQSLREFAVGVIPELKKAETVSSWSGLRPMTFDGFPMIGRVPGCNHVYVAGGHYRSGLHLSPATAMVITDLIFGRTPTIPLNAFRVGKQQTASPSTAPSSRT